MKSDQTKSEKIMNLVNEEDTVALVIGKAVQIKILHSFKKIGGTRIRPTLKVGCLFGNGAKATAIIVDTDQITASKEKNNPFRQCHPQMQHNQRTEEHQKSPSPTNSSSNTHSKSNASKQLSKQGRRNPDRKNRISPRSKGSKNDNIPRSCMHHSGSLHFEPNIRRGGNTDPLEIILVVKAAATDFNNLHSTMQIFANVNARIQEKRFAMWAFEANKSYIDKTTLEIEPDNKELQQFCDKRHSKCIIPSINQARTTQSNLSNHASILD